MNSRSKKYHEQRRAEKSSLNNTKAKVVAPSEVTAKAPKIETPGTKKSIAPITQQNSATQDDTGGGNDSGKRSDDN